jgi:flagellar biosynthesis/type III secretory pathway protein FliH
MVHYERIEMSEIETAFIDGEEKGLEKGLKRGLKKGRKEGIQQGIQQGVQQGIQQGVQQGIQQGMQQGVQQGVQQTALNFLKRGYSVEEVSAVTNLTLAELKELQKQ